MKKTQRGFNSTLRSVSLKKAALPKKKPVPRSGIKRKDFGTQVIKKLLGEGLIKKASSLQDRPRKKMKARAATNKGWVDVAKLKWEHPNNARCCEVCGVHLGDTFSPTFYHHLLHRGSYKKMARRSDNLAQLCPRHHDWAHTYGIEKLAQQGFRGGWAELAERLVALRNEANHVTT